MKKRAKKLVLAKETVRTMGLEAAKGGTGTYSCGIATDCGGSAHPYVCEYNLRPSDATC